MLLILTCLALSANQMFYLVINPACLKRLSCSHFEQSQKLFQKIAVFMADITNKWTWLICVTVLTFSHLPQPVLQSSRPGQLAACDDVPGIVAPRATIMDVGCSTPMGVAGYDFKPKRMRRGPPPHCLIKGTN